MTLKLLNLSSSVFTFDNSDVTWIIKNLKIFKWIALIKIDFSYYYAVSQCLNHSYEKPVCTLFALFSFNSTFSAHWTAS